jgi:hypothetical protein
MRAGQNELPAVRQINRLPQVRISLRSMVRRSFYLDRFSLSREGGAHEKLLNERILHRLCQSTMMMKGSAFAPACKKFFIRSSVKATALVGDLVANLTNSVK